MEAHLVDVTPRVVRTPGRRDVESRRRLACLDFGVVYCVEGRPSRSPPSPLFQCRPTPTTRSVSGSGPGRDERGRDALGTWRRGVCQGRREVFVSGGGHQGCDLVPCRRCGSPRVSRDPRVLRRKRCTNVYHHYDVEVLGVKLLIHPPLERFVPTWSRVGAALCRARKAHEYPLRTQAEGRDTRDQKGRPLPGPVTETGNPCRPSQAPTDDRHRPCILWVLLTNPAKR